MDSRFKKLKWNSILALCYQVILIITGLVLPRCFLHYYGSEVNGLITSITQFLAFINICDLGISAVVSASYYKPLADGDTYNISKIFVYSKRFFRIIGFILLAYVAVLLGVYPTVINNSFNFWFTFALIAAMSLSQLGQYFIGISYQLLLNSDQKSYVQLIVNGSTLLINTGVSVLLMVLGANIQIVKLTTSIIYLLRPLVMYLYVNRNYKIDKSVPVDKSVIPQKRNGIIQHIAYMVYSNTDVIVLTLFSTLQNVSVYSVYTLVTNSIKQIITAATTGVQSLLGNMIAKDEKDNVKSFYSLYNWGVHTICTILFTATGLLIVPFVKVYTSGITDTNYDLPLFALLITIAFFFDSIRNCQYVVIRAAGHFKQTQTASLIECFLNLSISIALVFFLGLTGVAIGTIIATVFFVIYEMIYFSKRVVFIPIKQSLKQFGVDALISFVTVIAAIQIDLYKESVGSWILQALVVTLIALTVSLIGQYIFYNSNLKSIFARLKQKLKKAEAEPEPQEITAKASAMNAQRSDILKLIYAAITKQKMELSQDFSIKAVMPIIKDHNITALCYYGAIECGIDQNSPEMCSMFNQVCYYIYNSEQQDYVIEDVFEIFDKNGVEYMPLKGILLKKLYPCPEMRIMGDLDILIKIEQYNKIKPLLNAANYTEIAESDHELVWNGNGVHIELHKRLIPSYNKDYYSYFEDGWRLAKSSEGTRYQMTAEDQLIYLLTHFAKHYRDGGIGVRQMVDLWVYRKHNPDLDDEYLKRELTALSLYDFYKNVYSTIDTWFEGGKSDEITDLITETTFNSGVFGTNDAHVLSEGVKIEAESGKKNAKEVKLLRSLFLPYPSMCKKYPVLKRAPILLPIMWTVRWFEAIFCKRKRIGRTLDEIKLMSDQNIDEQKNSLDKVGLSFNFNE